jgi:hypothetical protein
LILQFRNYSKEKLQPSGQPARVRGRRPSARKTIQPFDAATCFAFDARAGSALIRKTDGTEVQRRLQGVRNAREIAMPAGDLHRREGDDDERPEHKVAISKPLAVARFEATFGEWGRLCL